jgi:hypothetical protein
MSAINKGRPNKIESQYRAAGVGDALAGPALAGPALAGPALANQHRIGSKVSRRADLELA